MSLDYALVRKYASRGLLIDTNILLLYVVGLCDPTLITDFKRTDNYSPEDFELLDLLLKEFGNSPIVTTPNILTEVSDLADGVPRRARDEVARIFAAIVRPMNERYTPSRDVSADPAFAKIGLADTGIMLTAKGQYLVLTDDYHMAGILQSAGVDVINFNHLREL